MADRPEVVAVDHAAHTDFVGSGWATSSSSSRPMCEIARVGFLLPCLLVPLSSTLHLHSCLPRVSPLVSGERERKVEPAAAARVFRLLDGAVAVVN